MPAHQLSARNGLTHRSQTALFNHVGGGDQQCCRHGEVKGLRLETQDDLAEVAASREMGESVPDLI